MTKRTIEIDDDLDERVERAIEEVRDSFKGWLLQDPFQEPIKDEKTLLDTWYQGRDGKTYGCDLMTEAADSNTPIYFSDIDGLYYLYGDELEEAYRNVGLENGDENNHKQVAIYSYISEKVHSYVWETLKKLEEDIVSYRESLQGVNDAETELKKYIENAFNEAPKS